LCVAQNTNTLIVLVAGLRRLKGEYDQSADLEEMKKEKEEGEKEDTISILSLVGGLLGRAWRGEPESWPLPC
jgi:hypothetical protein